MFYMLAFSLILLIIYFPSGFLRANCLNVRIPIGIIVSNTYSMLIEGS